MFRSNLIVFISLSALGFPSATCSVQQHVGSPQIRRRQMGPRVQELPEHRSTGWFASPASQQRLHEGPVVSLDIVEGTLKKSQYHLAPSVKQRKKTSRLYRSAGLYVASLNGF